MHREQLEQLVADGATVRQIAERLGRSATNVRYWLDRYGMETRRTALRREARAARLRGDRRVELECAVHGRVVFEPRDGDGCFRCSKCRAEAVTRRRRRIKQVLVAEAGGRCALCGYDRCQAALHF